MLQMAQRVVKARRPRTPAKGWRGEVALESKRLNGRKADRSKEESVFPLVRMMDASIETMGLKNGIGPANPSIVT